MGTQFYRIIFFFFFAQGTSLGISDHSLVSNQKIPIHWTNLMEKNNLFMLLASQGSSRSLCLVC